MQYLCENGDLIQTFRTEEFSHLGCTFKMNVFEMLNENTALIFNLFVNDCIYNLQYLREDKL